MKSDGQGRMLPDALRDALRSAEGAPVIVCAQAGNVNTGSFDPLEHGAGGRRAIGGGHPGGPSGLTAA